MTLPTLPGIKRGAAFQCYASYDIDGTPLVFPANELKAQVRTQSGQLLSELTIAADVTPGRFLLSTAVTSHWPVGEVYADIKRTSSGVPMATQTFIIPVFKPITL